MHAHISSPMIHGATRLKALATWATNHASVQIECGEDGLGLPLYLNIFLDASVPRRHAYAAALAQAINEVATRFENIEDDWAQAAE